MFPCPHVPPQQALSWDGEGGHAETAHWCVGRGMMIHRLGQELWDNPSSEAGLVMDGGELVQGGSR